MNDGDERINKKIFLRFYPVHPVHPCFGHLTSSIRFIEALEVGSGNKKQEKVGIADKQPSLSNRKLDAQPYR